MRNSTVDDLFAKCELRVLLQLPSEIFGHHRNGPALGPIGPGELAAGDQPVAHAASSPGDTNLNSRNGGTPVA